MTLFVTKEYCNGSLLAAATLAKECSFSISPFDQTSKYPSASVNKKLEIVCCRLEVVRLDVLSHGAVLKVATTEVVDKTDQSCKLILIEVRRKVLHTGLKTGEVFAKQR